MYFPIELAALLTISCCLSSSESNSLRDLNLSTLTRGLRLSLLDGLKGLYAPPSQAGPSPEMPPCWTYVGTPVLLLDPYIEEIMEPNAGYLGLEVWARSPL